MQRAIIIIVNNLRGKGVAEELLNGMIISYKKKPPMLY